MNNNHFYYNLIKYKYLHKLINKIDNFFSIIIMKQLTDLRAV